MVKHRCLEPDVLTEEGKSLCDHNCTVEIPKMGGHSPRWCVYYGCKARWIAAEFEKTQKEQDPDWKPYSIRNEKVKKHEETV